MHPYRSAAPTPGLARSPEPETDDGPLLVVLAAVGLIRVVVAVATGEAFGAEPTVGLLLIALAIAGWWRGRARRGRRDHGGDGG